MKFTQFLTVFFALASTAHAGVKDFDDKFSLAIVFENHNFNLSFTPLDRSLSGNVQMQPNTAQLNGYQISYKGLTLAYLSPSLFSEESIDTKGSTSYEDIRAALFLGSKKQIIVIAYYNRFKGFFINNTAEVDSTADLFIKNTAMETFNFGANLLYVFSPDEYSAAAAYTQSDQQTNSGGSFLAMLSFDTNTIDGLDNFAGVPSSVTSDFGVDQNLTKGRFATTSASIGYAYTLVWKNFFVHATVLVGFGYQAREFTVDGIEITGTNNTTKQSTGVSVGYNGDRFFLTLAFVAENIQFETRAIKIQPTQTSTRATLGLRF